jgi:hypothetical protein
MIHSLIQMELYYIYHTQVYREDLPLGFSILS